VKMRGAGLLKAFLKELNYVLYIPEAARNVRLILLKRGAAEMIAELERLSKLGSTWAAASLAYLSLLPSASGTRDVDRARELCAAPAARGDPYALFVLGYALLLAHERVKAAETMLRASNGGFSPATLALAQFAWYGVGTQPRDLKLTEFYLKKAAARGHKAAFSWTCGLYRTGKFGRLRQLKGYVLAPPASLCLVIAVWRNPFSENVLVFDGDGKRPALRSRPNRT